MFSWNQNKFDKRDFWNYYMLYKYYLLKIKDFFPKKVDSSFISFPDFIRIIPGMHLFLFEYLFHASCMFCFIKTALQSVW